MNEVSRKTATYLNLSFQYLMVGLMIIRGIIIPPLAAQYIDLDLLGAWFASGNIMQWLMISEGGAWLYLRQRTAVEYGKGDNNALASVIGSGGALLILLGIVITVFSLSLAPMIPGWMNVDEIYSADLILAFSLTAIGMGLGLPAAIPRAVAHGLQRQVIVNTNLLVAEIISLATIIWLLVAGYGVIALGIGPLIREIIQNLLNWPTFIVLVRSLSIRPSLSYKYFKSMSGKMGWTFINNLSQVMRKNVDAIIVSQVFGNSSVLIVEWTKRAWEIFAMLITRASVSFTPAFAHLYGEGDLLKFQDVSKKLFVVIGVTLGVTLSLGLVFNEVFVSLWVGEQFYAGNEFNTVLGLATVGSAITFTLLEVLFATGNIKGPAITLLFQSLTRIALLFALIPIMGLLSVPMSLLLTEVLIGILYMAYQWRKTLGIPVNEIIGSFKIILRALVAAGLFAVIWRFIPEAKSWLNLFMQGALFSALIVIAYYIVEPFVREKVNAMIHISLIRIKKINKYL